MNTPHVHLLLNHVPTIGTIIAVTLLILSFIHKSDGLRHVSLELFFFVALVTLPAYLSGLGTALQFEQNPEVVKAIMDRHHDAALFSSIFMVLTAAVAWLCLWQQRRLGRAKGALLGTVLVLSVVTLAAMARTANLG